jgi:hypothetical protein
MGRRGIHLRGSGRRQTYDVREKVETSRYIMSMHSEKKNEGRLKKAIQQCDLSDSTGHDIFY